MSLHQPLHYASCGQFVANAPWTHATRSLKTHVLLVAQSGTLHIEQEGQPFELSPGRAMLLLAGETHRGTRPCEPGLSYFWCHFSTDTPPDLLNGPQLEQLLLAQSSSVLSESLLIPEFNFYENLDRISLSFQQLLHISNSNFYSPMAMDYCLTLMMMELTQQALSAQRVTPPKGSHSSRRLANMQEWIRLHLDQPISAGQLAQAFGYNVNYLTGLFKQQTGMSIKRYIHTLKMNKAKDLLLRTDLDIANIALRVGYRDVKYFMRLFKAHESMTPSSYRNAYFRTHTNDH